MNGHRVSVLLVSASEKTRSAIANELSSKSFEPPVFAGSAGEARRFMEYGSAELVIIDEPLGDDFGAQLAPDIAENEFTQVLVLAKNELFEQIAVKFAEAGILTVRKPMDRGSFNWMLSVILANTVKLRAAKEKIDALNDKLGELRLVDRAKLMLMEKYRMTESEAHRYIEKTAMDTCQRRREIAEKIIEKLK